MTLKKFLCLHHNVQHIQQSTISIRYRDMERFTKQKPKKTLKKRIQVKVTVRS